MLDIQSPSQRPTSPHPILNLSFRVFFSGAAIFAVLIMLLWAFVYMGKTAMDMSVVNPFYWHAHEMLYGYTLAVIAGFLLTAVKTWTGVMMPYGYRLLAIFLSWGLARCFWLMIGLGIGNANIIILMAAVCDLWFIGRTAWIVIKAVMAVKQYRQVGIVAKLVLLTLGNGLVYWGIFSSDMEVVRVGVYLGLYLVVGVVLTISRRVVPFFTERGINISNDKDTQTKFKVKNNKLLDITSLVGFFIFMLADLFYPNRYLILVSALTVATANFIRLMGWYHAAIWRKPLLWSLHLALFGCCISFVMFATQPWIGFSHSLAVHALAISGVGLMTVAMMARVSLGHTGRSIHTPPRVISAMFILMLLVFVFRVFMPLLFVEHYVSWLMVAQTCWIACFIIFCVTYLPILASPRPDKLFG